MTNSSAKILGLSFFYHDSAAAVVIGGKVIAAAQEERFTRIKHDSSFPKNASMACLKLAGIDMSQIDYVVFYEKPLLKFERILLTFVKVWPRGLRPFIMALEGYFKDKMWVEQTIRRELDYKGKILYTEHHYSHAASAYYCSGFDDATVVTMDGVGEWDTTTIGYGKGKELRLTKATDFPNSLGLLYSALTYYLGFKVNSAEYKVMGLAPYGDPSKYQAAFEKLLTINEDGSIKLNMSYFAYEYGLTMTNNKFDELFGAPARKPESPLTQREKDIAATLQRVTESAILKIAAYAKTLYTSDNLALAGGVALNCVANGKLLRSGMFKNIYIQPASGDAGGAVGAALYLSYAVLKETRAKDVMPNVYLGPTYSDEEIEVFLKETKINGKNIRYSKVAPDELAESVADLISGNNVIGLFEGRMEFGPRSLGNRSIIADARNKENWQKVNLKIKFRESFRPFAPSVLLKDVAKYFQLQCESPYMLLVADVVNKNIPAVTHVDNSARIQTVSKEDNPLYYDIIEKFSEKTGCSVIINTSFNVRGEPIVESPRDAFNCFINTYMDYLVMGDFILSKKENLELVDQTELKKYLGSFKLD